MVAVTTLPPRASSLAARVAPPHPAWRLVLEPSRTVVTVEDDHGALHAHVAGMLAGLALPTPPAVVAHAVLAAGPSCRTLAACLGHFNFTPAGLAATVAAAAAAADCGRP